MTGPAGVTALHQQVRRTIARYGLIDPGGRIVVGLSGGSDSVALVHLLLDLSRTGGFTVVRLAHLNHQLRPEAARDEEFCRSVADAVGVPITVDRVDVRACAEAGRLSVEDAARRIRYAFLDRAAVEDGADRVAVGHTLDDQAETVLLKLIRGAGLIGLGGVYPRKGTVIRPLLGVTREELRGFLRSRAVSWVDDDSNLDFDNPRNRVRHLVLPELRRAYGGDVSRSIARAAELAREDGIWLDEVATERYGVLADRQAASSVEFDVPDLCSEPEPIVRRVLLLALREVAGGREVGLDHVLSAREVLSGARGGADVPGGRVDRRRGRLVLTKQGAVS